MKMIMFAIILVLSGVVFAFYDQLKTYRRLWRSMTSEERWIIRERNFDEGWLAHPVEVRRQFHDAKERAYLEKKHIYGFDLKKAYENAGISYSGATYRAIGGEK